MAYQKQTFIDYPNSGYTVLNAEHLNHIEDGIATIHNDLYDLKRSADYSVVHQTVPNIAAPTYEKVWDYAEFSGWWGYVGQPQNFNRVSFPIKAREGYDLKTITVKILEMPNWSEVTAGQWGVTPTPAEWVELASQVVSVPESLPTDTFSTISVDFNEIVKNNDKKHLFLAILGSTRCTLGYCSIYYKDIEYNPSIYYAVDGNQQCTPVSGASTVGVYDPQSKKVRTMVAAFEIKNTEKYYSEIGTEKRDKFFKLVNECIGNSDTFEEIFDETWNTAHLCGSQNFTENTDGPADSTVSTFTGVIFPIGVVPADQVSDGCSFRIKARKSDEGDTTPITKVWAWLYSVEEIPYRSDPGYQFDTLNPTLLRTGVADCDIGVDTEGVITISWQEGAFSNQEEKFLMLGYNCNSLNNRCFNKNGRYDKTICSEIDGKNYNNDMETWYSVKKDGVAEWLPRWAGQKANAWSLVNIQKKYTLGGNFNNMLNEALDRVLEDYDIGVIPTSEVRLAKQYDLVVGDTFQLFYDGVVKASDINVENIAIRCPKGKTYIRYWEYTPLEGEEGTYTLSLYTRDIQGKIISSGTTKIVVHPKLTNTTTPSTLNVLIFGDSLTSSGIWAAEGLRRIYGSPSSGASGPSALGVTNTLITYGTKNNTINTFNVRHEGYGGWTWNSFLSPGNNSNSTTNGIVVTLSEEHRYDLNTVQKSSWVDNNGLLWQLEDFPSSTQIKFNRGAGNNAAQSAVTAPTSMYCEALGLTIIPTTVVWEAANPFYDEATQSISFASHAQSFGITSPDIVSCLLTWNGGGGDINFDHLSQINEHMTKAKELLTIIHTDFPKAKIIAMGLQLPSVTGGSGYNEGANGFYSDTSNLVDYAFEYNKALENLLTTDTQLNPYCYYVDTKGQFDARYNMPWAAHPVNTRSSTTEMRGTNGVHPSTAGYYQIGDAFYRTLSRVIPIIKAEKES